MFHTLAISQRWRYGLAIAASFACSLGGLVWALQANRPQDGGRGGVFGTAIAFAILFLRPDWGLELHNVRTKMIPSGLPSHERLSAELEALIDCLRINSAGQLRQNKALALASVVGTLIAGFGDWIVDHLIHLRDVL